MTILKILILTGMVCLIGTVTAMDSSNFDLSWNVLGGGGGKISSAGYSVSSTLGQIAGYSSSTSYKLQAGFWVAESCAVTPVLLPGQTNIPTDPDSDCIFEDLNGNGRKDFNDVVLFFKHMQWIALNEPVSAFDFNKNGRIDFNDIVLLFKEV